MKKLPALKKAFIATLAICVFSVAGCASVHPPSGFLPKASALQKGKHFEREEIAQGTILKSYRKIKIEPVELGFFSTEDEIPESELKRLAFLLTAEFKNRLDERYEILADTQTPDAETLVISPGLVFHKSPARLINAITTLLIFVPVTSGSAAFEAKISDGGSNRLLAQIAEKRTGALNIKSLLIGPYTKYTHAEGIFKKWAELLAEFLAEH